MSIKKILCISLTCLLCCCQDVAVYDLKTTEPLTRAINPDVFDWENADWMPTPPGQTKIPVPWVGQGSLASVYGLDVLNDRKKENGWELLYNSFTTNSSQPLQNPYFILYNKYRGILRFFIYITTEFIATSSYLQDGISVISNKETTLLNFLGKEIVDASQNTKFYNQIQPAPDNGGFPLASNKWYMMQYEIAYDPNIANIPYEQIQLNFNFNYYDVTTIDLGGTQQGEIKGIIGSSSSPNFFAPLKQGAKTVGGGVLAAISETSLSKYEINSETGENSLGLNKNVFKSIRKGLNSAISAATASLPGIVTSFLSGIIGGANTQPTPVSLNVNTEIKLEGTGRNSGSLPSMPVSFWVPGTNIPSNAVGYLPLYNHSLGVFNFSGKPEIHIEVGWPDCVEVPDEPFDPDRLVNECTTFAYIPRNIDYSQYLTINPEIKKIAKVEIEKQDLIFKDTITNKIMINPTRFVRITSGMAYPQTTPEEFPQGVFAVRFAIKITPNDNTQTSTIYKSFLLKDIWINKY